VVARFGGAAERALRELVTQALAHKDATLGMLGRA